METRVSTSTVPYVLKKGEGHATWFAGALMVEKAAGALDALDQTVPPGYAPPRHIHAHEDEAWYVLEGAATFICGETTLAAAAGDFVFLPRGVEHTFKVGDTGARLLTLAAPGGFAAFVREAGEPAKAMTVPEQGSGDPHRLAEIAGRYGIVITGPPPNP